MARVGLVGAVEDERSSHGDGDDIGSVADEHINVRRMCWGLCMGEQRRRKWSHDRPKFVVLNCCSPQYVSGNKVTYA